MQAGLVGDPAAIPYYVAAWDQFKAPGGENQVDTETKLGVWIEFWEYSY